MIKVLSIDSDYIRFSDGSYLIYKHERDCCEWNYAHFEVLKEDVLFMQKEFEILRIERADYGFSIYLDNERFFCPCYSEQNGYYSSEVDIFYKNDKNKVLQSITDLDAEVRE